MCAGQMQDLLVIKLNQHNFVQTTLCTHTQVRRKRSHQPAAPPQPRRPGIRLFVVQTGRARLRAAGGVLAAPARRRTAARPVRQRAQSGLGLHLHPALAVRLRGQDRNGERGVRNRQRHPRAQQLWLPTHTALHGARPPCSRRRHSSTVSQHHASTTPAPRQHLHRMRCRVVQMRIIAHNPRAACGLTSLRGVNVARYMRDVMAALRPLPRTRRGPFNFTPMGGQFDLVWLSTRTPHGGASYVW